VTGAAQHGQHAGGERRQDRHVLGIAAQQLLGGLQHHFQSTRSLQRRRGRHHGDDGEHHVHRRLAGGQAKAEDQEHEPQAAQQAERDSPLARPIEQTGENDGELEGELHDDVFVCGKRPACWHCLWR
jgi:hypothetical protein